MKLSEKLIELRKKKGWSQEEFAEKLEVSRQAISRWENGTALPDAQNILRISKLFDVTTDYLLRDDYECEMHISTAETAMEETSAEENGDIDSRKNHSYQYLILTACFVILAVCIIVNFVKSRNTPPNETHRHPVLSSATENEIAPTCTLEGSYDEVVYCTECNEEISRTAKRVAMLPHTLADGVKENEVAPTCTSEGSYDEVVYCTECNEEISRTAKRVAMLPHTLADGVKENEIAPTCTAKGSYDEVVYCATCDGELLRTHRSTAMLAHQFQDKKCVVCGTAQPSEGLLYMSNGNGTCFVSVGDCTDEHVVIPEYSPSGEEVVQIKAYAFAGKDHVKSIRIPETVTSIGEGAFLDCTNLECVNLPSGIEKIESYTFSGCKKLTEITIPTGVSYIGTEAFAECIACQSIDIPASVTKIGKFAFRNFSGCEGTVGFGIYEGWKLYDDSGNLVDFVDFSNSMSTPTLNLTFRFCEYTWKRGS